MVTPNIEQYLNIRTTSSPRFSPDGRSIAFLWNITGTTQIWQIDQNGSWPTQLTFLNEPVRGFDFHPLKHEIIFSVDQGGNEQTQLFRLFGTTGNTDHGIGDGWEVTDLTKRPDAVHTFGAFSHDGKRIAYTATRENPSRFDVYVQEWNPKAQPQRLCEGPGGYLSVLGFSPNDRYLLLRHLESNFNQNLFLLDVATAKLTLLTPHDGDVQFEHATWLPDGQSILCTTTSGGGDFPAIASIAIQSKKLVVLQNLDHEVDGLSLSKSGKISALLLNRDGQSELQLQHRESGKKIPIPKIPLSVISNLEISPDESQVVVSLSGPQHANNIYRFSIGQNDNPSLHQLTFAGQAGLSTSRFTVPKLIHYPSFDGKKIPAWYYPAADASPNQPRPVIVYPHGGPESQTRPQFNALFEFFVKSGYGVLAPNVRGSSGYGTEYLNADNVRKRMDSVKDLAHAAYWLREQREVDPKRLAVYGGSYGGFMVLAAVTGYPDLWAAGINVVGIANFVTFLEKTGAYRRAHREREYGSLETDREFLVQISPIHQVDRIRCPMMVIHGANDPRVPVGEAEQIVAALRERKIPVEYLRYEDEGHGLAKLKNRLDCYPKMVRFLDRFVKNRETTNDPKN